MSSCFISDLHLDDAREDIKKTFFKFLNDVAPKFDNLYILGDLFEVWIGDDYQDTLSVEVIRRLKAFSHTGKKIYFMHGNRDFLLGHKFAESCGGEIISDPYVFKVKDVLKNTVSYLKTTNVPLPFAKVTLWKLNVLDGQNTTKVK